MSFSHLFEPNYILQLSWGPMMANRLFFHLVHFKSELVIFPKMRFFDVSFISHSVSKQFSDSKKLHIAFPDLELPRVPFLALSGFFFISESPDRKHHFYHSWLLLRICHMMATLSTFTYFLRSTRAFYIIFTLSQNLSFFQKCDFPTFRFSHRAWVSNFQILKSYTSLSRTSNYPGFPS